MHQESLHMPPPRKTEPRIVVGVPIENPGASDSKILLVKRGSASAKCVLFERFRNLVVHIRWYERHKGEWRTMVMRGITDSRTGRVMFDPRIFFQDTEEVLVSDPRFAAKFANIVTVRYRT